MRKLSEGEQQALEYYSRHYNAIVDIPPSDERIVVADPETNTCRFCARSAPNVSFKKTAHALPELIGNKRVTVKNECDSCNEHFSRHLEDHLGKYLGLWRTMMQIHGKSGVVSYKSPSKKSRIDFSSAGIRVEDNIDEPMLEIDEDTNTQTITGYRQPYVPIAVYKSLLKMALSVIPHDRLGNFPHTTSWLLETEHDNSQYRLNMSRILCWFVPGPKPFTTPAIMVFERKSDQIDVPYMQMVLAFANLQLQTIVPSMHQDRHLQGRQVQFVQFPNPFGMQWEYGTPKPTLIDMSGTKPVRNEKVDIEMHFENYTNSS